MLKFPGNGGGKLAVRACLRRAQNWRKSDSEWHRTGSPIHDTNCLPNKRGAGLDVDGLTGNYRFGLPPERRAATDEQKAKRPKKGRPIYLCGFCKH